MNKKKYLALDAIRFSFRMWREHFYFIFKVFSLISFLLSGVMLLICLLKVKLMTHNHLRIIAGTLHWIVGGRNVSIIEAVGILKPDLFFVGLTLGFIATFAFIADMAGSKMGIMLYDKKNLSIKGVIFCYKKIPTYFSYMFIYLCALATGYKIFVVLGLWLEMRLKLGRYFILDKNLGTQQALKNSWNISRQRIRDMFLLYIMKIFLFYASIMLTDELCQWIGIDMISIALACYATFTYTFINASAHAFMYRRILEEKQTQLTPANVIQEDYNQIQKPLQESLHP